MEPARVSRLRRVAGAGLMLAGGGLFVASSCPYLLAIADYFDLVDAWNATCPDALHVKMLLIAGIVVGVIGQRLYSGRDLRTGEKPKIAED
jgi:hypothetical protein